MDVAYECSGINWTDDAMVVEGKDALGDRVALAVPFTYLRKLLTEAAICAGISLSAPTGQLRTDIPSVPADETGLRVGVFPGPPPEVALVLHLGELGEKALRLPSAQAASLGRKLVEAAGRVGSVGLIATPTTGKQ